MKIEINIDIEALVRDEIRNYIRENIQINNVAATITEVQQEVTEESSVPAPVETKPASTYEYAPELGKRRSKIQKAMHAKEVEVDRRLTEEEKSEFKNTFVEEDATAPTVLADIEALIETNDASMIPFTTSIAAAEIEEVIPQTDNLNIPSPLFK
jgi:hypothetical protein